MTLFIVFRVAERLALESAVAVIKTIETAEEKAIVARTTANHAAEAKIALDIFSATDKEAFTQLAQEATNAKYEADMAASEKAQADKAAAEKAAADRAISAQAAAEKAAVDKAAAETAAHKAIADDADPYDPDAWDFHPGLDGLITRETLAEESQPSRNSHADWLRGFMNRSTKQRTKTVLDIASFAALAGPQPDPQPDQVAYAYDVALDRTAASVWSAWRTNDGRLMIQVVKTDEGADWLPEFMLAPRGQAEGPA